MKAINERANHQRLAKATSSVLNAVLFVCANTNSCTLVHQPKTPEGLDRFSKVK